VGVQIDASRPLPLLLVLLPAVHGVFLFFSLMTTTSSSSSSSSSSGKERDPCMVSVSGDCFLAFDCVQLRRFCGAGAGAVACLACASSSSFSSVVFLVVDMR
jgi:hypothetical protein